MEGGVKHLPKPGLKVKKNPKTYRETPTDKVMTVVFGAILVGGFFAFYFNKLDNELHIKVRNEKTLLPATTCLGNFK